MGYSNYTLGVGVKLNTADVQKQLNQMSKTSKIETSMTLKNGDKVTKTITTYKDSLGKTVQATKIFNQTQGTTSATITKVSTDVSKASGMIKSLGNDFVSTTGKVIKFGAATAVIGLVTKAISEAVRVVKEYDDAITEMRKVSDLSADSLDKYTEKLREFGSEVGRTTTTMVELTTNFLKAGYDEDTAADLAKVAA